MDAKRAELHQKAPKARVQSPAPQPQDSRHTSDWRRAMVLSEILAPPVSRRNRKRGFSLLEMLIVIGIIAILLSISIPVMKLSFERSREAVDKSNLHSAYAEVVEAYLLYAYWGNTTVQTASGVSYGSVYYSGGKNPYFYKYVKITQQELKWQDGIPTVGPVTLEEYSAEGCVAYKVSIDVDTQNVTVAYCDDEGKSYLSAKSKS